MKFLLPVLFSVIALNAVAQSASKVMVHFEYNKSGITPRAKKTLDSVFFKLSTSVGTGGIDLYGHCDYIGNDVYNDSLSVSRVNAVKSYLAEKGWNDSVFHSIKGYGKRQPIAGNSTPKGRADNRRVELIIHLKEKPANVPIVLKPMDTHPDKTKPSPSNVLSQKLLNDSVKAGSNIVLSNLEFYENQHNIYPESIPVLQELLEIMKSHPTMEIELDGYICCIYDGRDGYDMQTKTLQLSVNRAKAVYMYLVRNGIDASRLSYKGFGSSNPLVVETTAQDRRTNRRVEVKIIKK